MRGIEHWIQETVGGASDREIARLADIGQSTLSRQRRENTVTVETAMKIARAYQVSVIPALLALGIVSEFDIEEFSSASSVSDASDETLIAEVLRRMKEGKADWAHEPISKLDARRGGGRGRSGGYDDGTVREWDESVLYAADGSVDEELAREERGEDPVW